MVSRIVRVATTLREADRVEEFGRAIFADVRLTKPGESSRIDLSQYSFTGDDLKRLPMYSIIMHPLPRRTEIDTACDNDPRAMYWRQMRNGMWIRSALIATNFGRDDEITQYYMKNLK